MEFVLVLNVFQCSVEIFILPIDDTIMIILIHTPIHLPFYILDEYSKNLIDILRYIIFNISQYQRFIQKIMAILDRIQ